MNFSTKIRYSIALILIIGKAIAQTAISDVAGYTPNPKSVLDLNSTTKGLLIPRMTTVQRNAIPAAPGATPEGLTVFDTDTKNLWIYKNSAWLALLPSPWEASGTDIFNTNTGKVGIGGTPDIDAKLKVYGETNFSNQANTRAMIYNPNSSNNLTFSGGNAEIKTSNVNSNLILQSFSDLKLGIGNINPTQKVDIDGQIRIRGGSPGLNKVLTSEADGTATWQSLAGTHNHYAETWTGSEMNGLTVSNFGSADFNVAIRGFANNATRSKGILGSSASSTGIGVLGTNTTGSTTFSPADNSGVSGVASSGTGVFGTGYSGRGIWGLSNSAEGVFGSSVSSTAVLGQICNNEYRLSWCF